MAQTRTNIRLTCTHRTGVWMVTRPGEPDVALTHADTTLDQCAAAAGLSHGYWLRNTPELGRTTWTWVQL